MTPLKNKPSYIMVAAESLLRVQPKKSRARRRTRGLAWFTPRRLGIVALIAGIGLVGSCILLIYVLGWSNSSDNQIDNSYPMSAAAENYWRNLNVAQVQRDMAKWSPQELALVFATVQSQSYDPATRAHIADLGQKLELPGYASSTPSSFTNSLLSQPGFLIGMTFAFGFWFAAAFVGLAPIVRRRLMRNKPLDPMSTQGSDGDAAVLQESVGEAAVLQEHLPDVSLSAPPPEVDASANEKKENENSSDQAEEPSSGLGDLASLFEEEDTSLSALEAFCKNLSEIVMDDLATKTKELARDLRKMLANGTRRTPSEPQNPAKSE